VLYVKNLKSLVTEDELRQVFEPYGQIGRVKKTKDYGFIHFERREDALRAMEELNGTVCCSVSFCVLFVCSDLFSGQRRKPPVDLGELSVECGTFSLQCFDTVGSATGRASSL